MKRKRLFCALIAAAVLVAGATGAFFGVKSGYPRPYREEVEASGLEPFLVYSLMKAESGFRECVVSSAGAVGIMQLKPSTAEFICGKEGLAFEPSRLKEGKYNVTVGCLYLKYLLERFEVRETALAAYNAGEGTVGKWLGDSACSDDGKTLKRIPYPETASYVKKIRKFMKIYEFFY